MHSHACRALSLWRSHIFMIIGTASYFSVASILITVRSIAVDLDLSCIVLGSTNSGKADKRKYELKTNEGTNTKVSFGNQPMQVLAQRKPLEIATWTGTNKNRTEQSKSNNRTKTKPQRMK